MVGSGTAAMKFEGELVAGLQPKFEAEMETLRLLKVAQTGQADAKLELSDVAYYTNRLKKEKYAVDTEALRVYFPYQPTLEGMFAIYQKIFGLKFTQVEPPYVWAAGVQLYVVEDAASGAPIGAFYLDMFPREGKLLPAEKRPRAARWPLRAAGGRPHVQFPHPVGRQALVAAPQRRPDPVS
jgi:Zn-dependent oligopeptidase